MKRLLLLLPLLLATPAHGQAIGMYVGEVSVGVTLTKLGENDYQMDYNWSWGDYWFPTSGTYQGYPVAYYLYEPHTRAAVSGYFPGTYEWSEGYSFGHSGWFKFTAPPIGQVGFFADEDIAGEIRYPDGNARFIAGELSSGSITLLGDVPTEIGQSVGWAQTPEPATLCLLGLGLLAVRFRRKAA